MKARPGSPAAVSAFAARLGHRFRDESRLAEALTHSSASGPARPDNQRLEFLGDRVLGLVVAQALIAAYPEEAEGTLAPRLNALVRRETLAEIGAEIGLGAALVLGRSENLSGGRRKAAILADAVEAVIAAIYLDGGLEAAERFVLTHWQARIAAAGVAPIDAKTRLQEWAQGQGLAPPAYTVIARSGPDHAPDFTVEARLASGPAATGTARAKKIAEQAAAEALLVAIEQADKEPS
ncbi:MAG: ribonuclease III [Pseudomonadota bacterium]